MARFHARLQRLQDEASPKNFHEFRVACRELLACYPLLKLLSSAKGAKPILKKALRYLLELRVQANAADRAMRKALKDWQETLGNIGDLGVMGHYAHELGLPKSLQHL